MKGAVLYNHIIAVAQGIKGDLMNKEKIIMYVAIAVAVIAVAALAFVLMQDPTVAKEGGDVIIELG